MNTDIGGRIKRRRQKLGLTQEELAARTELSKGFISQLERDLTSPSIATLMDILEALGTNVADFFAANEDEKVVFTPDDMFVSEDAELDSSVCWLVPNAQKNALEPILVTIQAGGSTYPDDPHEGEEFGYVLSGSVSLVLGLRRFKLRKGDSFCFKPAEEHYLINTSSREARVIWVATPPSF
ncbi:MAG: cupin domain-containing protein [Clostridia bacterium]|jgi:transcriptional regulator with XRE-family HTH domain|nr:cupin domain-containing protein [Clostridia bacterium]MBQ4447633.1 cupin domain-containing protein [Clostridia bacterium]MBR3486635.1 cupin domain-containing protein [Clostridia bacterium]